MTNEFKDKIEQALKFCELNTFSITNGPECYYVDLSTNEGMAFGGFIKKTNSINPIYPKIRAAAKIVDGNIHTYLADESLARSSSSKIEDDTRYILSGIKLAKMLQEIITICNEKRSR